MNANSTYASLLLKCKDENHAAMTTYGSKFVTISIFIISKSVLNRMFNCTYIISLDKQISYEKD